MRSPLWVEWAWTATLYSFTKHASTPATLLVYTTHCSTGIQCFGIGIGGVRMRSNITPFSRCYIPADFSWREESTCSLIIETASSLSTLYNFCAGKTSLNKPRINLFR
jgi:hypothetical protein